MSEEQHNYGNIKVRVTCPCCKEEKTTEIDGAHAIYATTDVYVGKTRIQIFRGSCDLAFIYVMPDGKEGHKMTVYEDGTMDYDYGPGIKGDVLPKEVQQVQDILDDDADTTAMEAD